ncbi:hypothetical protein [Microcoleus sp. Pol11C3]
MYSGGVVDRDEEAGNLLVALAQIGCWLVAIVSFNIATHLYHGID